MKNGMVTAPHHLASEAGLRVLRDGGNAIEAIVATAASLAVVYPHMNGIGGDAFWLISEPGRPPRAIRACGPSGEKVDADLFRRAGLQAPPARGPLSANTVAGTVDGWRLALELSDEWGGALPLARLLEDPIRFAEDGYPVSAFQAEASKSHGPLLSAYSGFAEHFLDNGKPTAAGSILRQPALGRTLRTLASAGPDDFYRGRLAASIAADLERAGVPITAADLAAYRAAWVQPLTLDLGGIRLFNLPPPSQGLASMIILGLARRLDLGEAESFEHIHGLVEATKRAFAIRDAVIADPSVMTTHIGDYLEAGWLEREAGSIDMMGASPWLARASKGDTVWLGAIDGEGRAVSMIQSVFLKFGSGVVLPETGILWQNRGAAFSLDEASPRYVAPRRLPFHTLNPAFAEFADGRRMVYGSMGGDGQPQFQSAFFSRYAFFGQDIADAIAAPRWLVGRFDTELQTMLRVESDLGDRVVSDLENAGHAVVKVPAKTSLMGHAGAVIRDAEGNLTGASDPRSDGAALGF